MAETRWARRTRRAVGYSIAAVLLLTAAACGDDDDPAADAAGSATGDTAGGDVLGPVDAATGEPLRIGFITDGQNQATDQSIDLHVAEATVEYLNEHRGGIAGRPVELVTCEAKLDPAVGTDCANRMVEEGVPVVVIGTTGVVESVWNPLHEAGVPTMFFAGSGDPVLSDPETTFSISNPIVGNILLPLGAAEQNDLDKVTVIVIDVPAALAGYEGQDGTLFDDAGVDLELVRVPPGTADMTAQLQPVVAGDPGVVHVLGNDSFCISAYQALQALGYDGPITSITQCVTDATRQAIGGALEGVTIASAAPVGIEDESTELYRTVVDTYADEEVDTTRIAGVGAFLVLNALDVSLEGIEGDVTPESVITTVKAMPESDLPGGGGLTFRCDGSALEGRPAVCTDAGLITTLDAEGFPTGFELTSSDG